MSHVKLVCNKYFEGTHFPDIRVELFQPRRTCIGHDSQFKFSFTAVKPDLNPLFWFEVNPTNFLFFLTVTRGHLFWRLWDATVGKNALGFLEERFPLKMCMGTMIMLCDIVLFYF